MLYVGVILIASFARARFVVLATVVSTALTILGFSLSSLQGNLSIALTNRILVIVVLWTTAVLSVLHKRQKEETRTLRGLLPICATCKKIRDDKGYWQRLEKYMEEHSTVHFSHGICDDCLIKEYPELEAEVKARHEHNG